MRRAGLLIVFGIVGLGSASQAHASSKPVDRGGRHTAVTWQRRDVAVYVVSTINLLRVDSGRSLASSLTQRYGVGHFDVYADMNVQNLYYIELRRNGGAVTGALAYQMGWLAPRSVSAFTDHLGVPRAADKITADYQSDPRTLLGTFRTTVPR